MSPIKYLLCLLSLAVINKRGNATHDVIENEHVSQKKIFFLSAQNSSCELKIKISSVFTY